MPVMLLSPLPRNTVAVAATASSTIAKRLFDMDVRIGARLLLLLLPPALLLLLLLLLLPASAAVTLALNWAMSMKTGLMPPACVWSWLVGWPR